MQQDHQQQLRAVTDAHAEELASIRIQFDELASLASPKTEHTAKHVVSPANRGQQQRQQLFVPENRSDWPAAAHRANAFNTPAHSPGSCYDVHGNGHALDTDDIYLRCSADDWTLHEQLLVLQQQNLRLQDKVTELKEQLRISGKTMGC